GIRSGDGQEQAGRGRGHHRGERLRSSGRDDELLPGAGPQGYLRLYVPPRRMRRALVRGPGTPHRAGRHGDRRVRAASRVVLLLLRADADVLPRLRPGELRGRGRADHLYRAALRRTVAGSEPAALQRHQQAVRDDHRNSRRRDRGPEHADGRQPDHELPDGL
ncbi:MAG: Menaquinone-cytochrome C oxidoreductase, cytochrome C subunit, partial [uncultured Rubrobacteraceae bacterium]